MSVNSAGSASNVNFAVTALRQTVQPEQVAAAVVAQAGAVQQQANAQNDKQTGAEASDGRGATVNVEA